VLVLVMVVRMAMSGVCVLVMMITMSQLVLFAPTLMAEPSCFQEIYATPSQSSVTCSAPVLSCDEIKKLKLNYYLGHGEFKISFLTKYNNRSYALRFAAMSEKVQGSIHANTPIERKRDEFRHDWLKGMDNRMCNKGLMRYLGTCDTGTFVGDVAELLYAFDNVEKELLTNTSPWLWCWPVNWLRDVTNEYIFYLRQGLFVKKQTYERRNEFGISASTGTIKQPDLGNVGSELRRSWVDKFCELGPGDLPRCDDMRMMNEWLHRDCNALTSLTKQSNCAAYCNISTFTGMSKLGFTYLMHTFGRRLLRFPSVKEHPIYQDITNFLFKQNYFEFPLPKATHFFLEDLWHKYNGESCIRDKFVDFMDLMETRLMKKPRKEDSVRAEFLHGVLGRTMEEAIAFDHAQARAMHIGGV